MNSSNIIKDHFYDKGFYNTKIEIIEIKDTSTTRNDVTLTFKIDKGKKIKIKDVIIKGNEEISDNKLRSQMKDTKRYRWWRVWKSSRFAENNFKNDKEAIIKKYNDEGFRNAKIISDSVYLVKDKNEKEHLFVELDIEEGQKFSFRKIGRASCRERV